MNERQQINTEDTEQNKGKAKEAARRHTADSMSTLLNILQTTASAAAASSFLFLLRKVVCPHRRVLRHQQAVTRPAQQHQ